MDLSFNMRMEAYYQKFYELQEKLRRSEEERLKLEMKFNELVRISKEEEQAHYKKLRSQYKRFLEEDRKRQERNEKIIRTLERIEARVNMLSSKTERIKMLRHQYQSYLQRVSQRPATKPDYIPPKITEEPPCNQPLFDYDKKSSDIAMLKKAYGKTNDEKIEILDKYLQSLKSQKDQVVSETKPKENNTDFSKELKYLDEVSKKLNEGFSSNEANSIAEDIMNSIYARHYKTDAFKEEPKKVSKFTSPNYAAKHPDSDKNSGFGDTSSHQLQNNYPLDKRNGDLKRYEGDKTTRISGTSKFNENSYSMPKNIPTFERQTDFNKTYENVLKDNVELPPSKQQPYQENRNIPNIVPDMHNNNNRTFKPFNGFNNAHSPSKTEMDLIEREKVASYDVITPEVNWEETSTKNNEIIVQPAFDEEYKEEEINNSVENPEFWNKEPEEYLNEAKDAPQVVYENPTEYGVPENQFNDTMKADNDNFETEEGVSNENLDNENKNMVPSEEIVDTIEVYENQPDPKEIEENNDPGLAYYERDQQPIQYDESQVMYAEGNQPLRSEDEPQYTQIDQYDSSEQPVEKTDGEGGEVVQQYSENQDQDQYDDGQSQSGQQVLEDTANTIQQDDTIVPDLYCGENNQPAQNYDENSQPVQQYEENNQPIQQYDENVEPVEILTNQPTQQLDENGQFIQQHSDIQPTEVCDEKTQPPQQHDDQHFQQYDEQLQQHTENDQPIQQYDENGQPIQQYDENGQPIQLYDQYGQSLQGYNENEQYQNSQPVQQYDEYGQPIQQYDENGQPLQQYDANGQPMQQYDENGQPLQQYDENGQPIQGYDENGQPIYFSEAEQLVQYDENGQIQQYDNSGQIYGESYQPYDANGQPIVEYQEQLPKEFDENGQVVEQYNEGDQQIQNVEPEIKDGGDVSKQHEIKPAELDVVNQPPKTNVLDLLDTDSESVKQNTSKISHDSDFDFSNG